jgi:hypothetical protein
MKTIIRSFIILIITGVFMTACSDDFLDINVDPKAANFEQVQVEYFINASIIGAQMNPHDAERAFVLYWKTAGRQHRQNGALALGSYNDGWSNDYYNSLSGWLKNANLAIQVAEEKIEEGVALPYTENLMHIARIWRAYLMSEFADNFGPMPIGGFRGSNPEFSDLQTVYYHMLDELGDAVNSIDTGVSLPGEIGRFDQAYGFDFNNWIKYANSMRMRLAMRLSEVDPDKARSEFEAAAAGDLILEFDESFTIQEGGGWDDLTAVMSREWNAQLLSATLNNLYIGLGGIPSEVQLPAAFHDHIKPEGYMGVRYEDHFGVVTNDPSAGFWFDGLHHSIDPRAYQAFIIPGWFDNPNFSDYPSWTNDARVVERSLLGADDEVMVTINGTGTWNAASLGNWGDKAPRNQAAFYIGTTPRLSQQFRQAGSERIFFANWETYFLIAEGAVRGWNVPMDGQTAYENGITASLGYWGVSQFAGDYIQSESYNRAGTSVSWNHTAEPPSAVTMNYIDGYTLDEGAWTMNYPVNHLYQNGAVRNDHLTKVITQKYLAQVPYLPLEAWNDHRRLGLPFFENPSVELPIVNLPELTPGTAMESRVKFFPQRLRYPSGLERSNPAGYQQALGFLGGPDEVLTPLWWAKQP